MRILWPCLYAVIGMAHCVNVSQIQEQSGNVAYGAYQGVKYAVKSAVSLSSSLYKNGHRMISAPNDVFIQDPVFLQGFRVFWGRVVEISSRLKIDDEDEFQEAREDFSDPQQEPIDPKADAVFQELYAHFVESDPRFVTILFNKEDVLRRLFQAANLAGWMDILLASSCQLLPVILERFWSDSLSEMEQMSLDARFNPEKLPSTALVNFLLANSFNVLDFVDIEEVLLNPGIGLDIRTLPEVLQDLFHRGILGYFRQLGPSTLGRIVEGVMALTPEQSSDQLQLIATVMNRVGPAMQKIMQLFGNEVKSENLRRFLDMLKDSIEPMSEIDRQSCILEIFNRPQRSESERFTLGVLPKWVEGELVSSDRSMRFIKLKQRVGSASVAEGWTAEVQFPGSAQSQTVFLKLMRWDVRKRLRVEIQFLNEIKQTAPKLIKVIDELSAGLLEELDFEMEAANQYQGYVMHDDNHNKKNAGLFVPRPLIVFESAHSAAIVMTIETGITLKKLLSDGFLTVDNACRIVDLHVQFMAEWIKHLVVMEGFGHGDPHVGNVLIGLHPNVKLSWMTILDWGNVIKMSPDVQRRMRAYGSGIIVRDESTILEALGRTEANRNDTQWTTLKGRILALFERMDAIVKKRKAYEKQPHELSANYGTSNDHFSLHSLHIENKIILKRDFSMGDRIFVLLDNIVLDMVAQGLVLPDGMSGMLRARKFLETTLDDLRNHAAVIAAKCEVPSPFGAFFKGLSGGPAVIQTLKESNTLFRGVGRNIARKFKSV